MTVMAAPSRLPDVADRLVMLLGSGVTPRSAAEQVGIGYPTLTRWLRLGAAGDPRYRELHRARSEPRPVPADLLERLRDAEPGIVGSIVRAAQGGDWRAAAWIAERVWPERWGAPARAGRHGPAADPLNGVDPATGLPDARYLRVVK
jgi:hypothetical protein